MRGAAAAGEQRCGVRSCAVDATRAAVVIIAAIVLCRLLCALREAVRPEVDHCLPEGQTVVESTSV